MRKAIYLLICLMPAAYPAVAQTEDIPPSPYLDQTGSFAGDYLCIAVAAGGLIRDPDTQKWRGTVFNVDGERFAMKVSSNGLLPRDWLSGKQLGMSYTVEVSASGQSDKINCMSNYDEGGLWMGVRGMFACETGFKSYRFNLTDGKYQATTEIGYVDDSGDTPSITAGECVKF